MKVSVDKGGPCRLRLHIAAGGDEVASDYEQVLGSYLRLGKVPGFRKGKAPRAVVERRYAGDIRQGLIERAVPRLYREALEKENVNAVAIVGVSDVKADPLQGVEFDLLVDVAPEFKLPKYAKLKLKPEKVEVTDERVEERLAQLLDSFSRFEDVEGRELRKGDLAIIDYAGTCEGRPVGDLAPDCSGIGEGKEFWAMMGEPEFLPGFADALPGAAVGETRTIEVTFPGDYHVSAVAGKQASYEVTLKGIREKVPPELNEAFFKRFDVDSEQGLRERLHRDMLRVAENEEQARLRNEAASFLLENTSFDLPQSVVEQESRLAVRNMVSQIAAQGATHEQIVQNRDAIVERAERSSKDRVKLSYILNRIAAEENIKVTDEEVEERIHQMAMRYRMRSDELRAQLEKRNGLESVRSDVQSDKTVDFLVRRATAKA